MDRDASLPGDVVAALKPSTRLAAEKVLEESIPLGSSHFGGRPDLSESVPWPRWSGFHQEDLVLPNGTRLTQGFKPRPLSFLAQLDLATLPVPSGLLPDSGLLLFFYDAVQQPWGFDPRDRGSSRVLFLPEGTALKRTAPPPDMSAESMFTAGLLSASLIAALPTYADRLGIKLEDPAYFSFGETSSEIAGEGPHHRLLGWPEVVQSDDMDLECQLASSGVFAGGPAASRSPEAARLLDGATDWMLLLQLSTDDDAGWMWGDTGSIYFWIRKQDLAERRFENVWTILQCY